MSFSDSDERVITEGESILQRADELYQQLYKNT